MRTSLLVAIALLGFGCGDDGNKATDAPVAIDAAIDAARPVLPLTAQSYCDTIQAACTTTNAQYADATQCLGTAAKFTPGAASTETSGDTLGCRIYHAQNAMISGDTATHCPHAGPAGAKVDAATGVCSATPCDAFCGLEAKLCGTDAAPVTGVTNRYTTVDACKAACANFTKTTPYNSATTTGNTFSCRIYHLTNAAKYSAANEADNVNTHCGHTLSPAMGQCT